MIDLETRLRENAAALVALEPTGLPPAASIAGQLAAAADEISALRDHRDQLTEDLGSLEDRMQELLARVASEYRNGHAAGMEAAMESVAALRARVEKAEAFKAYVHQRLDEAGVPHEVPESPHTAAGCRIGGRLDWLLTDLAHETDMAAQGHVACIRLTNRVAELERALRFMLNVFGQDGLGDGAEGDAVEHARKAMRLPSNKPVSRFSTKETNDGRAED